MEEDKKPEKSKDEVVEEIRDEELDISIAVNKAQNILRNLVGNLSAHQFKLESVKPNGSKTRYIIISSLVPDLGTERDYYFIKIDIETGKHVPPMGSGKLVDGKVTFKEIVVDSNWEN